MKIIKILILFYISLVKSTDIFLYETILDHDNKVQLEWNVQNETIRFKLILLLEIKSTDYLTFGFGMSDRGRFENAEFILFEINQIKNQKINLIESYTNADGFLKKSISPNKIYKYVSHSIDSSIKNQIELIFDRQICNANNVLYQIDAGTVHIIHFIYNNKIEWSKMFKPTESADSFDMKQTQLIKSTYNYNIKIKLNRFIDIKNNNIQLPSSDTTYWCKVFKLPNQFKQKHHITAFESIISESSKGIVHHMELFHCVTDPSPTMLNYNGPCNSEAKPEGLIQCRKVVAAWAMGATRFIYPANVGGVIGGLKYSPYLVLEIHYDNAKLKNNIIDSSGMRIFYQGGANEPLRQFDAGILEVGLEYNPKMAIPPNQNEFSLTGYCLSECTSESISQPITIFASQLHTHLTGRRIWTSLVRNNKLIEIINSDNHYDQMFQEIRLLRRPVRVEPGDTLITKCVYETNSRLDMTVGGYSIRDEMCVNYMHYYPLMESQLEVCKSSISDQVLDSFFTYMSKYDSANTNIWNKTIRENFNEIRWTPLTSLILSRLYDVAPIAFSCNSSEGIHISKVYKNNLNGVFDMIKLDIKDKIVLDKNYAPLVNQCL